MFCISCVVNRNSWFFKGSMSPHRQPNSSLRFFPNSFLLVVSVRLPQNGEEEKNSSYVSDLSSSVRGFLLNSIREETGIVASNERFLWINLWSEWTSWCEWMAFAQAVMNEISLNRIEPKLPPMLPFEFSKRYTRIIHDDACSGCDAQPSKNKAF